MSFTSLEASFKWTIAFLDLVSYFIFLYIKDPLSSANIFAKWWRVPVTASLLSPYLSYITILSQIFDVANGLRSFSWFLDFIVFGL